MSRFIRSFIDRMRLKRKPKPADVDAVTKAVQHNMMMSDSGRRVQQIIDENKRNVTPPVRRTSDIPLVRRRSDDDWGHGIAFGTAIQGTPYHVPVPVPRRDEPEFVPGGGRFGGAGASGDFDEPTQKIQTHSNTYQPDVSDSNTIEPDRTTSSSDTYSSPSSNVDTSSGGTTDTTSSPSN